MNYEKDFSMEITSEHKEKIENLERLLASINTKNTTIAKQTKYLNAFSRKMETLMLCFEAYSIDNKELERELEGEESIRGRLKELRTNQQGSSQPGSNQPGSNQQGSNQPGSNQPGSNQPGSNGSPKRFKELPPSAELPHSAVEDNPFTRGLSRNVIELIKKSKSISLDDLIKGIKQSKYKVIEVINALIKERVIVKSFDKGFVYKLSQDFEGTR